MRSLATIGTFLVGATAAACAPDQASRIPGCYSFDAPLFEWGIYDSVSESFHTEGSPVVELLPARDPRLIPRPGRPDPSLGVRMPALTDTATAHWYAALSFWGLVAHDSIWLVWTAGGQGWRLGLRSGRGGLFGSATEITDEGGVPPRHLEHVRATRIPCPQRLLPSRRGKPIYLADYWREPFQENVLDSAPVLTSWPRRRQLVGADTAALRGTVDIVIVVDSLGHVETASTKVSDPSNGRLAELVPALLRGLVFRPGTAGGRPVRMSIRRHLLVSPDSLVFRAGWDTFTVAW